MLFVIRHEHECVNCPVDHPEPVLKMASREHARKHGVRLKGSYVAAPEHTFYFIVEADSYELLAKFLRPLMKLGKPQISPVEDLATAVKRVR
ncbi:MAG: DUF3303 family protein [Candidatus Micrarchaeia archaeon]